MSKSKISRTPRRPPVSLDVRPWIGLGLLAGVVAAFNLQLILAAFSQHLARNMHAALGVIKGEPLWRMFQSRVLGPYSVKFVADTFGIEFGNAYVLSMFLLLFAFYLVIAVFSKQLFGTMIAAVVSILGAAYLNLILMRGIWLYIWDFFELIAMAGFFWAVLTAKPLRVLVWIVVAAAFNRESAFLLALWLVADACVRPREAGAGSMLKVSLDKLQLRTAALLAGGVYAGVEFLRNTLMVRELGPTLFKDVQQKAGATVHVQLELNYESLSRAFASPLHSDRLLYCTIVFGIPLLAYAGMRSGVEAVRRLSGLTLMLWGFTVVFGVIFEYRVWLTFVPYLVLVGPQILGLRARVPAPAPAKKPVRSKPVAVVHQDSSLPSL